MNPGARFGPAPSQVNLRIPRCVARGHFRLEVKRGEGLACLAGDKPVVHNVLSCL